jgi:hypothetical protein
MLFKFKTILVLIILGVFNQISQGQESELDELLRKYPSKEYFFIKKKRGSTNWFNSKQIEILSSKEEEKTQKALTEALDEFIIEGNPILKKHQIEYWGLKEFHWSIRDNNDLTNDVLTVKKIDLGNLYLQRIKKKYKDIKLSLSQKDLTNINKYNFNSGLYRKAESKLNSIIIDEELLLKIAPSLLFKDEEIVLQKESINKSINDLKSKYIVGTKVLNVNRQQKTDTLIQNLNKLFNSFKGYLNTQGQQLKYLTTSPN